MMTLADSLSVLVDAMLVWQMSFGTPNSVANGKAFLEIHEATEDMHGVTIHTITVSDPFVTEWQWWLDNTWSAVCQADNELAIYQAEIDALIAAL